MEKYSWFDFIAVMLPILLVYYAFVFFKYYFPYMGKKDSAPVSSKGNSSGSDASVNDESVIINENPFIQNYDEPAAEIAGDEAEKQEKNINNINISDKNNNLEAENSKQEGREDEPAEEEEEVNPMASVLSTLPTVSQEDPKESVDEDQVPIGEEEINREDDIDLSSIIPDSQELDFIDMVVTDDISSAPGPTPSDNKEETVSGSVETSEVDEQVYLNPDASQMKFDFGVGNSENNSEASIPQETATNSAVQEDKKESDSKGSDDDTIFDFNY